MNNRVRGTPLVWAACVAVLARCCLPVVIATPMEDEAYTPWVPFPPEHHVARSSLPAPPQESVEEDAANTRMKRVFLSRGWGPGGYDAPAPQPPQRYVRRPPLPQSSGEADMGRPFASPLPLRERPGGARFAALVSSQQQKAQQKPQYRRFHSIFTSGTWSPLGKRGAATLMAPPPLPLTQGDSDEVQNDLQVFSDRETPFKMKDKRSGVFASHGWGAGGSSPPSSWAGQRHPWLASLASGSSDNNGGGGSAGSGDRYVTSFSGGGGGPLFHHFLSHGWRPMGR